MKKLTKKEINKLESMLNIAIKNEQLIVWTRKPDQVFDSMDSVVGVCKNGGALQLEIVSSPESR